MPPYISARLRLLFSPLNPSPLFLSNSSSSSSSSRFIISPRSFFPIILSSSQPPQRRHQPFNFRGRGNSTFIHTSIHHQVAASMDDNGASVNPTLPGFNKRRAEGRDKTDRPKNLQLKVRKLNPTNTISYVQILGTGMDTQDTSPSVLLFFDKQRFIFNAGEGLQRFCTEHKIKLSKIDHIFLSRVCSETAGGLPGLLLTLAGIGEEGMSVNLWGPSNLKYLVDAMKCFIPHAAMVHTRSFGSDMSSQLDTRKSLEPIVLVDDEVVKISALLLRPQGSEGPEVKPGDMSVIYICELPEIMGKFDPGKAKALGLRAGPKYGELQKGKSVKSDRDNIMVHPSDVMDPPVPGPIIFLVDCPTEAHVQDLLSTESLDSYCTDNTGDLTEDDKSVNCIVHLSPSSVIISPSYQKWMSRFSSAQQIIAGHKTQNVEIPILKSSARVAARLNYLCPQFFPAPGFWSLQDLNSKTTDSSFSVEELPSIANERISAENLLKFTLRPHAQLGLDKANIPSNETPSEIIGALIAEIPEIVDAAKHVGQFWDEHGGMGLNLVQDDNNMTEEPWLEMKRIPSCLDNVRRDDLEIVLLGTGSSQPSKYRNVSSVYINLFSKGSLMLDCGEGTLGQLKRRYGLEGADNAVRNLSCAWISHIHADHHTGLARILALRRALLQGTAHEPLLVVGPGMLRRFLVAYQNLEDLDFEFLDCRSTTTATWDDFKRNSELKDPASVPDTKSTLFANTSSHMQSYWKTPGSPVDKGRYLPLLKKLQKVLNEAGLESLISFPVVHCPQAFGVALKSAERKNNIGKVIPGWKIVYSGDTRPCLELEEASHEATVLIHEATFEDGLMEEAVAKNHSTTKEAIQVGDKAGAYRIILTHFSQRYPKIPLFDDAHMHKTCIAFDLMSVNLADLPVLPSVLPYLKLLFKDEMVVDESDDVPEVTTAIA